MENPLYRMMISNAASYIRKFDTVNINEDTISIWEISQVLAICTGKLKEDIVCDIVKEQEKYI